jgi:hypothetical protein
VCRRAGLREGHSATRGRQARAAKSDTLDILFLSVYRSTHAVKPFTTIAIVIFSLMAVLHVLRLIFGWEAVINGLVIPMWASVVGTIVAAGLAVMLWRESRPEKH